MDNGNGLPSARNRRYSWASSKWTPYVGDLKALETFLDSKKGILWLLPKFIDSLLRGIGQVVFANNPISGLLILLGLFWAGFEIGLATVLAASTAILTAVVMRMDSSSIRAGLTTFNAVLVGCVTASLWTPLYKEPLSPKIWAFIVLGSMFTVFVASGLGNIFSRWNLPALTLPFNVVTLLLFTCLMPPAPAAPAGFPKNETDLDWAEVLMGSALSMGEVFAVDTLGGSILMFIGIVIFSPLMGLMTCIGAVVGTLFGLVFVSGDALSAIYIGIWGYNGILSSAAIGGFFFAPNVHSILSAVANVIFTVLIQHAMAIAFVTFRLPVLTMPFVLSTLMFLAVSTSKKYLHRVTNISFPEMHRHDYLEELRHDEAMFIRQNLPAKDSAGRAETSLP